MDKASVRIKWGEFTSCIYDDYLRDYAEQVIASMEDKFYTKPASSSGKYHPRINNGEQGLFRHMVIAGVMAHSLLATGMKMLDFADDEGSTEYWHDIIVIACGLHDIAKYGTKSEGIKVKMKHPVLAHDMLPLPEDEKYHQAIIHIREAIYTHHGNFSSAGKHKLPTPSTSVQEFVHLVDYIVSRNIYDSICGVDSRDIEVCSTGFVPSTENMLKFMAELTFIPCVVLKTMDLPMYSSHSILDSLKEKDGTVKAVMISSVFNELDGHISNPEIEARLNSFIRTSYGRDIRGLYVTTTGTDITAILLVVSDVPIEWFIEDIKTRYKKEFGCCMEKTSLQVLCGGA